MINFFYVHWTTVYKLFFLHKNGTLSGCISTFSILRINENRLLTSENYRCVHFLNHELFFFFNFHAVGIASGFKIDFVRNQIWSAVRFFDIILKLWGSKSFLHPLIKSELYIICCPNFLWLEGWTWLFYFV